MRCCAHPLRDHHRLVAEALVGKVVGPGQEWKGGICKVQGSVCLVARGQGSEVRSQARGQHRRGSGQGEVVVLLVEMTGGGSRENRIIRNMFLHFPRCLLCREPVFSIATTIHHSMAQAHIQERWNPSSASFPLPHSLSPLPAQAQRHLPPILLPPTLQRKPQPAGASSLVSHFLSVPLVYFPHTARGKSLLRIKSPGGFPWLE